MMDVPLTWSRATAGSTLREQVIGRLQPYSSDWSFSEAQLGKDGDVAERLLLVLSFIAHAYVWYVPYLYAILGLAMHAMAHPKFLLMYHATAYRTAGADRVMSRPPASRPAWPRPGSMWPACVAALRS